MTIATLETEIITQLSPIWEQLDVLPLFLPQLPNNWASEAGHGWVAMYWESTEQVSVDIGVEVAEDLLTYGVDIRVRELRGDRGLYAVINMLRSQLFGFEPTNAIKPTKVNAFNYSGMAKDYFVATGQFQIQLFSGYSQQYVDPSTLPTLTAINFADDPIATAPPDGKFTYDDGGGGADLTGIYQR